MNDDPSEVDVLYAVVHADEILQQLVDSIVEYCSRAGKNMSNTLFHLVNRGTVVCDYKRRESKVNSWVQSVNELTFKVRYLVNRKYSIHIFIENTNISV